MSKRPADAPLTDADYQSLARFRYALRTFLRFSERSVRDAGLPPAHHQLALAVRGYPGDGATRMPMSAKAGGGPGKEVVLEPEKGWRLRGVLHRPAGRKVIGTDLLRR